MGTALSRLFRLLQSGDERGQTCHIVRLADGSRASRNGLMAVVGDGGLDERLGVVEQRDAPVLEDEDLVGLG